MKAFIPHNTNLVALVFLLLLLIVSVGYKLIKLKNYSVAINLSWLLVSSMIILIERVTISEAPGFRMMAIIMVTLFAMKIPVTVEAYRNTNNNLKFNQWFLFVVAWFGMRPKLFESYGNASLSGAEPLVRKGFVRVVIGIVFLGIAKIISFYANTFLIKLLMSAFLLVGVSFILHFGLLTISAGMWRRSGVDTRILFKEPLLSSSLTEFWGKRWNLAFSEMTSLAIFRPLKKPIGIAWATILAFLFSGFLHEIAISFPVQSGYGLPMLFFGIQGLLMLIEKELERRNIPIYKNKIIGRMWVIFWLVVPLPLLFHKVFIKEIIWPLIGI